MRYTILFIPLLFIACRREQSKPQEPNIPLVSATVAELQAAAGPMFSGLKDRLDLSRVQRFTGGENVAIFMARFKDNENKIYATNSIGELLYVRRGNVIGLLKEGEAIRIEGREIRDMAIGEYHAFFTQNIEPKAAKVSGFCQRQKNQNFGDCYKQEVDEFCDSFISCLAINTQPSIHILIGLACSCMATPTKFLEPIENDTLMKPDFPDTLTIDL